ncbi:MAG: hypothetical protein JXR37_08870 [Kiritimatiellae bacterium]|nr:hypothetical protein [Kiritimatiellia bacterium]
MRLFTRLKATVTTGFDSLISRVENHEALVAAAIGETKAAAGKVRVRLQRVRRDTETMRKRIAELEREEEAWRRRAVEAPQDQDERGLECVRRRRRARREREHLAREVDSHVALERQLTADLRKVDERIAQLQRRKNTLSAREYRTRAVRAGELDTRGIVDDIDEILDRWEAKLTEKEPGTCCDRDAFEAEYVREEEDAELRRELDALRAQRAAPPAGSTEARATATG